MSDKEIRLECLRITNGDLAKAKELYAFVTEETTPMVMVPTNWTVASGGQRPSPPTTWIYSK